MAEISAKESPYDNMCKSLLSTSTPHRSIDDSGYCTQSSILSNAASNLSQISEVTSYFDASSDICLLQLSSNTHNFSMNHNVSKLEDVIYATNSTSNISSSFTEEELSPTKKFKLSSDMRLRYRLNNPHKDNENEFLKRKNPLPKSVNHERICLEDREKVDIMYFLAERHHFEPVTEKIFSFLSGSDIVSMSMVSKIWLNAVENSPMAQKKKRLYFKLSKENRSEYDGKNRSVFHNKGCLANIGNVMRSPSKRDLHQRSPPVSPSKYRFHVFQKEAKKLSSDQQLVPCPRCTRPSSWSPSQSTRAECKGLHCRFIFCTNCMCEYSDNSKHQCLSMPKLSTSSCSRHLMMPSLSRRKHNLRRLL